MIPTFKEAINLGLECANLRPLRSFGLNCLDHKLAEYVKFRDGYFVDAGGNDSLYQSNTAYFERYLGCRGLLIEPIPHVAELCAANRSPSRVEQCALVPFGFDRPNVTMTYCNLMSLVEGPGDHRTPIKRTSQLASSALATRTHSIMLDVFPRTLTDVHASHKVEKIDLHSLSRRRRL